MTDISGECTVQADDDSSQDLQSSDHDDEMDHPEKADDDSSQDLQCSDQDEAMIHAEEADNDESEEEDDNIGAKKTNDDEEETEKSNDEEEAEEKDDDKGAKKANGDEGGEKPKDDEDGKKGDANNDEEDEEEQYWAPLEEMVAEGLIKDPRPIISTEKPGKGAHEDRAKLAERFWKKWSRRPSNTYTDEQEDELLLIHATRHGLTPKAILAKGLLKSGDKNNPGEIAYRIKKLKGKKTDLTPRTKEQAWKEHKARTATRTPLQQETENLKAAIRRRETIEQIVASGIVPIATNTRRAIRKRWDDWLRLGESLPKLPS
ncbi:MAG: hypothetical protein LQ346_008305 [Caloplaca aetnensis]|nr:MAG: hypothetical protein LQ346_008305 [Caloplaca aetnensis]